MTASSAVRSTVKVDAFGLNEGHLLGVGSREVRQRTRARFSASDGPGDRIVDDREERDADRTLG